MKKVSLLITFAVAVLVGLAAGCVKGPGQTLDELLATEANASPLRLSFGQRTATPSPQPAEPAPGQTATLPPATATPTLQPTSALGADPSALHGAAVRLWHPWSGELGQALQDLAAEFTASNDWGITVQIEAQTDLDSLAENVRAAIESGAPPDLAVGYLYQALAWEDGLVLADLDPYLDDPQWGLRAEGKADFFPVFWDQGVVDGRRIGLPALGSGQFLLYNQTWAEELGFSAPPATAEELRQQACAAAETGAEGLIISTHYSTVLGWIQAFDGQVTRSGGSAADSPYNLDTPQAQEAFTFLRSLYDQKCAGLLDDIETEQAFAQRQGLFASGSLAGIPYQVDTMRRMGQDDQWTLIPFPGPQGLAAFSAYGPSYVMLSEMPEQRLASWLFLRWLLTPQNQARLVEAAGSFPLSASSLAAMQAYRSQNPQWAAAVDQLPHGQIEPAYRSWEMVRWALSDAATQLFRSYFSIDQVPQLMKFLEETAADLHLHPPGTSFTTPADEVPTPTGAVIPGTVSP